MPQIHNLDEVETTPTEVENVVEYLGRVMPLIASALRVIDDSLFNVTNVAPTRTEDGMIRYADGTNWNPGSGEGMYAYFNAQWNKL